MAFDPKPHLIQLPRKVKDRATGQYVTVYDDYLEVKWRLCWFRDKFPHGVITTEEVCVDLERGYARYKAIVEDGEGGRATGYGTETAAGFEDYVERAETRALGRALAALGIGTQFVGQDLDEMPHVADAPVANANGQGPGQVRQNSDEPLPEAARISRDQARELKRLAQTAFGYAAGEARLRQDLGLADDARLTLMRLAAHTTAAQYQALIEAYSTDLQASVEADVP
jgi:hypothetical protein